MMPSASMFPVGGPSVLSPLSDLKCRFMFVMNFISLGRTNTVLPKKKSDGWGGSVQNSAKAVEIAIRTSNFNSSFFRHPNPQVLPLRQRGGLRLQLRLRAGAGNWSCSRTRLSRVVLLSSKLEPFGCRKLGRILGHLTKRFGMHGIQCPPVRTHCQFHG